MNIQDIKDLQQQFGYDKMQNGINDGSIWLFEGSVGREAMRCLESGICYLPETSQKDYYGNHIPSRDEVEDGTTGSLQNSINFWQDESNYWEWELEMENL